LQTANAQSKSSKDSKAHVTAIKSLPGDPQDPTGQLLTRALADLEHCQNSGKLKDEQITALKDTGTALREQIRVEEAQIAELRKANEARRQADTISEERFKLDEERFKLQEQRLSLYKTVVDDFEKEVNRLRAKLLRAEMWGNINATVAAVLAAWIGFTLGNK
jgi:chromosome segregation ATPase